MLLPRVILCDCSVREKCYKSSGTIKFLIKTIR
uniref:Uncharacterized protein n=1 Tax=Heterorhabditis bacteriophora TaxID=37862 RepID=A0A1I7WHF9_HETBA